MTPTPEEQRAINALKRIAKKWPQSIWLFAASGSLWVMRKGPNGEHVHLINHGVDPEYTLDSINLPTDGGDW